MRIKRCARRGRNAETRRILVTRRLQKRGSSPIGIKGRNQGMKISKEYILKNGRRWAVYGVRLGLASSLAIYTAHIIGLQFETQAGVICIFSMLTTSKDTIRLSASRLISFIITAISAFFLFQYVNEFIAYGIFIFITIYFSEMMGWGAALSANVVAGTHFLSVSEFTPAVIVNEFFIVLTGMGFALIFNLFRDTYSMKDQLDTEILVIQSKMQTTLTGIADYIELGIEKGRIWEEIHSLEERLEHCIRISTEFQGNRFTRDSDYYFEYFEMRRDQCQILANLQWELQQIRMVPAQAAIIVEYILYMSLYVTELNAPSRQLEHLQTIFNRMKEEPLPETREEFENRAILYHVLMDLEDFLLIKQHYLENQKENIPKV